MPVARAIERSSISLSNSSQKTYTLPSHLRTQYEVSNGNNSDNNRTSQRRPSDIPRKANVSSKNCSTTSTLTVSHPMSPRRSLTSDTPTTRGRSTTDVQSVVSSSTKGLKQQQLTMNGSGSDKSIGHDNQQQQRQSSPPKPKCSLPTTTCQPGYVTSSKLFNMMGYGLQNQYLFMHAHYLYIIDCRSREKFDASHIVTGKNLTFF
jgi:hypothetical protein